MPEIPEPTPIEPTPEEDSAASEVQTTPTSSEESQSPPPPPEPAPADVDLDSTPDIPVPDLAAVEEVSEPTKFQRFMRKVLIWFGVVAGSFLAGFLVFYFVLHQPKVAELTTAQEDIQTLEAQLDTANTELLALNNADKHRTLLQTLVDTYEARLALVKEEPVEAKAALSGTAASLAEISDEIAGFDSDLAEILPQRLALIKANIDRDPETALADCDQMIADLLAVEKALFP